MKKITGIMKIAPVVLLVFYFAQSCNPKKMLPTAPIVNFAGTATQTAARTSPTFTGTVNPAFTQQSVTASPTVTLPASRTPFVTATVSATATSTLTLTPVVPKGAAYLSPAWAVMNSTGNTWKLVYGAGTVKWASSPSYGTLKMTVPAGFSAPSLNAADPGYFTVSVTNGTLLSFTISSMQILVQVRDLAAATGTITINYGDRSGGGPGAAATVNAGMFVFSVEMTENGGVTSPIDNSPELDIVAPLGLASISPQAAACGYGGNTAELIYIPQTLWGNGTLKVTIPGGFSQPSLNPGDPGYFTVSVNGGTLTQVLTDSMNILVSASSIPNDTGRITLDYGSRSGGGPGFTAPSSPGGYSFTVESDNNGTNTHPISAAPVLIASMATATVTRTFSITPTATATCTITLTSTISRTYTVSPTVTKTSLASRTRTPTFSTTMTVTLTGTITRTFTVTATRTVSPTLSITRTITPTYTITMTKTATSTASVSPTFTSTRTVTGTKTATSTKTPTFTQTSTITTTFTATPTFTPHEVDFPDANLDAKIRAAIGKPSGIIYSDDLEAMTTLNAFGSGIADLTGIDECTGLVLLTLYNNSITSIAPLSGLRSLTYLDVNMNQISDITPLVQNVDSGGLTNGAQVILNNNPLGSQAVNTDIPYLQSKGVTVSQ